jgi:glucose-1-phosphate thymidylyltransferase
LRLGVKRFAFCRGQCELPDIVPHCGGGCNVQESPLDVYPLFACVAILECEMAESYRIDKAVVLARGRGTRMRRSDDGAQLGDRQAAIAETGVKAMMPIDRPFLDYVLTGLADAGYRQICLVIGPEHNLVRDYYTRQIQPQRIEIEFAIQRDATGTADAVAAAEPFTGKGPFLAVNSDNFYPLEAYRALQQTSGPAAALFERDALLAGGNIPADRIAKYAVCEIDDESLLRRIIEKPDALALAGIRRPVYVSMNVWRFGPTIFQACRSIQPSERGEYELVSAVQYAIDVMGERFRVEVIRAPVLDLTTRGDVATVAAKLAGMEVRL